MDELTKLRKQIDQIDDQIIAALAERVKICKAIGQAKKDQGKPVKDTRREKKVYKRIKEKAISVKLNPEQIERLYHEIVDMCSKIQEHYEKSQI